MGSHWAAWHRRESSHCITHAAICAALTDRWWCVMCVCVTVAWREKQKTYEMSSQVFSVQNQMCDMMKEIDKERDTCEAQIENRTTGRLRAAVICYKLPNPHAGSDQRDTTTLVRQQKLSKPRLWLYITACMVGHQPPCHMCLGSFSM